MIVFRADFSPQTGLQPLRRCAYLTSLLKKSNEVLLCCREDKRATKFLSGQKISFSLVKDPAEIDISAARAVIFDLASFASQDAALLNKAKQAGIKTIQFLAAAAESQAADIAVSPSAEPQGALLHHKFRHFNKAKRKYRKKPALVFVNLGDMLSYRDLRQVVDSLHRLHLRMKIAPGIGLKKADKRNLLKIYPGIHFCGKSESPARAYFEADLALVVPGEFALEAAAVGTPALYMPLTKEQENLADAGVKLGTGVRIPSLADFSLPNVRDAIMPLDQETREKMGLAGKALVDGLGVQRFLSILKEKGIIV